MNTNLRTFYTMLITQILSLIGSRMTGVAVGIWVFAETGSAAPLLIAAFFAELPQMAGGIFTGWAADKFSRKHIIMLGDAGQAVGSLLLLWSVSSGQFQLWHLYSVMLMQGIFGIIQSPASDATVALLVPESHRDRANGLRSVGFPLAGVVAPALAGLVYSVAGLAGVITLDLLTFVVAVIVIFMLTIPNPEQSEEGAEASENWRSELMGGLTFLWRRPVLLGMVVYLAFVFFLINGPLEMTIPYMSTLTNSETTVGILLSLFSFGAFAGALVVTLVGNINNRMRWILWSYMLHGVMLVIYGITRNVWLMGATLMLLLFPLPLAGAWFNTILQTKTPPDMQGRVFAITGQIFTLTTPFSFLITAYLVDNVLEPAVSQPVWQTFAPLVGNEVGAGMGLLMLFVGVIIIIATSIMIVIPSVRQLEQKLPTYEAVVGD
jgi:DHA3 family macrolide efflux protein-like MFS transporter